MSNRRAWNVCWQSMVCLLAEAEHGISDGKNRSWYVCWQKQNMVDLMGETSYGMSADRSRAFVCPEAEVIRVNLTRASGRLQ